MKISLIVLAFVAAAINGVIAGAIPNFGRPASTVTHITGAPMPTMHRPQPAPVFANTAELEERAKLNYARGRCNVHLRQYEKNKNGNGDDFAFDIQVHDQQGQLIGNWSRWVCLNPGVQYSLESRLKPNLMFTCNVEKDDSVAFEYNNRIWSSADSMCSVGKYDGHSKHRDMDCWFECL